MGYSLKRRVQHYGYAYDYKNRSVDNTAEIGPLPEWIVSLRKQIEQLAAVSYTFDQVIVNEYEPGQGISGHIDCISCFEDTIVSVSLLSACVMQFTHEGQLRELLLQPGSLLVLNGDARYSWKHAIKAVKNDKWMGTVLPRGRRVSVTFRKILR